LRVTTQADLSSTSGARWKLERQWSVDDDARSLTQVWPAFVGFNMGPHTWHAR
jgi:hypothetical protein